MFCLQVATKEKMEAEAAAVKEKMATSIAAQAEKVAAEDALSLIHI